VIVPSSFVVPFRALFTWIEYGFKQAKDELG
jgi:hypothetical protein